MTALPSNLAFVGEDLARAISRDAHRSARRRRTATIAIAIALLVLTATAAIANGWLFDETPTLRAVPSLGGGGQVRGAFAPRDAVSAVAGLAQSEAQHRAASPGTDNSPPLGVAQPGESRRLLSDLGSAHRALTAIPTTSGGVCLALTDFTPQCVPTFKNGQEVSWFVVTPSDGPVALYGLVRDNVTAVEAVFADGRTAAARLANNAFYLELTADQPGSLVAHLADGSSDVVAQLPCPLTNLDCTR